MIIIRVHQGRTADQEATITGASGSGLPLSFRMSASQGRGVFSSVEPGPFETQIGTTKRKMEGRTKLGMKGQPVELEVKITERVDVQRDGDWVFAESAREGGMQWWSGE